ncbi:hypothetical protein V2G26_011206 [Clonostachys chloroleuca]
MKVFATLAALLPLVAAKVTYEGYKVFRVESHDSYPAIETALADLGSITLHVDGAYSAVNVAIAPEKLEDFHALGLDATLIEEDLASTFEEEKFEVYESTLKTKDTIAAIPPISYFNAYHTFAEHGTFLSDLQAAFPSNSEIFTVGNSFEGRAIRGIHLWGSGGKGSKPAIVWHGTVHAREWITTTTVEYLAYKIVEEYLASDATTVAALNNYDFYILPIVNPDGFVYTQTTERLWRKNRQTRSGVSCVGTDINRNWPYQWSGSGSSTNACAETYRGLAQGDTPENKALVAHLSGLSSGKGIKFYNDWHSYSQLILLPFGYSCSARATNHAAQMSAAGSVATAIRGVNGLSFTYGPTCSTIYQANGGSLDWAYAVAGAEYSWCIELRPSSSASNGFVLAASHIVPSGAEQWAGMKKFFTLI